MQVIRKLNICSVCKTPSASQKLGMRSELIITHSTAGCKTITLLHINNDSRDAARHVPTGHDQLQLAADTVLFIHSLLFIVHCFRTPPLRSSPCKGDIFAPVLVCKLFLFCAIAIDTALSPFQGEYPPTAGVGFRKSPNKSIIH